MTVNDFVLNAYILGLSLALSLALTALARRLALRWGVLDHPVGRKIHLEPMPLLGGSAIFLTFYLVVLGHLGALALSHRFGMGYVERELLGFLGEDGGLKMAGILAGGALIFALGVVDDLHVLSPRMKLLGQIAAGLVLVASGMRIDLFIFRDVFTSSLVTLFWVVLIINSMNLLDNMDGLSGGVSIIAAATFFLCVQPIQDERMVRLLLLVFMGAVGGFLWHNLPPARIFMGDCGAMFNGYFLATVAVVGTFHIEGEGSRIAVAAPLLALSVPMFDTFSVVWIRLRHGDSIFLGDKRHFSHRLVDAGMSKSSAVWFIYLVAGVVGLGGALLPRLDTYGTLVILLQTGGVFMLIVLLMKAGKNGGNGQ
ncbi:MAG: undecaprenyl/decaprenyl-phosphate alpha-N-acetylglucosaminyl 1-phosphate transferase [Candidatus Hydrogenedens sp.]|nr:undecaprenyl/decaprenyl-phosphate alpha-N-acetylglucosaminyl 1-phosphate transferase [Candidatus Hydrogenedens sp.]